jgi:HAE1 family hydrophobic/amphiphilic exporter-1
VNPPAINIGGRGASSVFQFTLQSADLSQLYSATLRSRRGSGSELLRDVNSDLRISNRGEFIIDRDKAASLGITPQAIETA